MGLDIYAYNGLKLATEADEEGFLVDNMEQFAGREVPLFKNAWYKARGCCPCLHMSYGGYGRFRRELADLAGWGSIDQAWAATSGPCWELLNFADNEGVLGLNACRKLLADFEAIDEDKAKEFWKDSPYFFECFIGLRNALAFACADGLGCLHFT